MNGCETLGLITALACAISQGKSLEDLELLSIVFSQLGTSLATIAAQKSFSQSKCTGGSTPELEPDIT